MIYYFCPDVEIKSGGVRRIYDHVSILLKNNIPAAILHTRKGFKIPDTPAVNIKYVDDNVSMSQSDIMVIPEGYPGVMVQVRAMPFRKFVLALSWKYIFNSLPDNVDWRNFNIERVIVSCPVIGDLVSWSMGLPVHQVDFSVNQNLYFTALDSKELLIVFLSRKGELVGSFRRLLRSRNSDFVNKIKWKALQTLSEEEYATYIRKAAVYLNLSFAEGLAIPCYQAMSAGTIVAGFNSVGCSNYMVGEGPAQNCILAETGDYFSLAQRIEPLLIDLLERNQNRWSDIIKNGQDIARPHTPDSEELSVLNFWKSVL